MEGFLSGLVKQRLLTCLFFLLCIVFGINAFQSLPIDAFPDLANNQVQILTEAPGMAPVEVEELITVPLESIMNGLPGVTQVRSNSKFAISVVSVVFEDRIDNYFARQLVLERLQSARSRLPRDVNPQLGPITTAMGEIYQYIVSGNGYSPGELKTLQDWDIKYLLRTVPGVTEVNTWGGLTPEYTITLIPGKLQQYGLTLQDVFSAIKNNNDNFGAGIINHGSEQYTLRGTGRVSTIDDLRNITVKSDEGTPVFIKNIADVSQGSALRQGAATCEGKGEVITGIVMMLKGENSRAVIKRIEKRVQEVQKTLPEGVRIKPFYNQAQLVEETMNTVRTNLLEGGFLVIAVLLLMLGNWVAALIVALTIPLAMLFSFIGMKEIGITANIMSLGAIDFGMIVDGSIVMVENTLRKLSQATGDSLQVVQESVREMARPIFFGVLIIAVVYMPILSLQGMEYKMFSPMVFTVCFALLGSLLIALTLVPALCSVFLKGSVAKQEGWAIKQVKRIYLSLLEKALAHKFVTASFAVAGLALTLCLVPYLGTEFVPELDEGSLMIGVRNLPSISLPEALKIISRVEKTVMTFPEVSTVVTKTGRPDLATDPMGVYQSDVFVALKPRSDWPAGVSKASLSNQIRDKLNKEVPESSFNLSQPIEMRINELVSGVRSDIAVRLFGEDMDVLEKKAAEIKNILSQVRGQTDLQIEQFTGSGQLLITPDRDKMARYGVNVEDIKTVVQTAGIGTPVSEVLKGRKRFDIRVRFPEIARGLPESIGTLLVESTGGQRLPLSQVAKIEVLQGLDAINRESGQRRIIVQCNIRGRDIGSFVQEAQEKIHKSVKLPPGYYIRWGGQFENQQRAMNQLLFVVPLSVLIIFVLLVTTFGSTKHALLVMTNVPFALIGGVIALWWRGMYLSVPASIGFVALFGVAVLNGVVLISTINQLTQKGEELETALKHAAEMRLRPVLMTALVATLGFLPMAMSTGAGAEIQKPLATVVIGGLVSSTLLTLFVLPVIYSWVCRRRVNFVDPLTHH